MIDLRTLRPFDLDTVLASVREDQPDRGRRGGAAARAAGRARCSPRVTEQALGYLDDAWRIATPNTPIPYSPPLEDAFLPGPDRIVDGDPAAAQR